MEQPIVVSGRMIGRVVAAIQSMILELFLPVYTGRKKSSVGIIECPDRNIRITVEVLKPNELLATESKI